MSTAGVIMVLIIGLVGLYIFFVPSIIANRCGHPSALAIFALNLFLGWTFVGWVLALVWALAGPDKRSPATPDQLLPDGAAPAEPTRACPYCAEPIRLVAIKCKHCGSDLLTNPADLVGR